MALNQSFNQDALGNIGVSGAVTTASPTYTTGTNQPASLTTAGALRVDGSAVTQPVSAASLPLPTGAATAANQSTEIASLATIATETTAISGQLPATLGQKTSANSLAVVIASDQSPIPVTTSVSATGNLTSVSASVTSVTVLASNSGRKGCMVTNDSTAILYLAFTATASTAAYSLKLFPNSCYITDTLYTGVISGIWSAANGAAKVTEFV